MKFNILYKYTSNKQIQQWQIFTEEDKYWTEEGIQNGKLTTSLPTFCIGKNIGKKNKTTNKDQAIKEAMAKYDRKIKSGYNLVLTTKTNFFSPMLAEKFEEDKIDFKKTRVFMQPKLDGIRCINNCQTLMSRKGTQFNSVPHLSIKDRNILLDGELYNHLLKEDFNEIVSLSRKKNPSINELEESKKFIQYWVYDYPELEEERFSKRYEALIKVFPELVKINPSLVLTPTYEVFNLKEVKQKHEKFLEEGYEGSMVRIDGYKYECKRSNSLLKYKEFIDEEFKIVGYEEGVGGRVGTIGKFILAHDKREDIFKSNVKGNFKFLKEVWLNRESYLNTQATVKYFNRTPLSDKGGDIPRFPYIIKLNRNEYE